MTSAALMLLNNNSRVLFTIKQEKEISLAIPPSLM